MTAMIILAAGASTRLGRPKQNLLFQGQTLLQRCVGTAINTPCRPIILVLGANNQLIEKEGLPGDIKIICNDGWNEGMASSIRAGINAIGNNDDIDSAIILLCDQPFVNAELIGSILAKHTETDKKIIACTYNNTIGVPALFHRSLFAGLSALQGHEGAKSIIKTHMKETVTITFDLAGIDIDTMADYEQLTGTRKP